MVTNLRLNLDEALAVHLATRLLTTRMDRQNVHAASALRKLGISLEKIAPTISEHVKRSADLMDADHQRHSAAFMNVLETLTLAWAEHRKVQIWHRNIGTNALTHYHFSLYFIEPYAVGHTMHAIGFCDEVNKLLTFKIERIEQADLVPTTEENAFYNIPETFDVEETAKTCVGNMVHRS